jgi:hypothetical protein
VTPRTAITPILALALLAACSSPGVNANVGITPSGVTLTPSASVRIAGANVTISP